MFDSASGCIWNPDCIKKVEYGGYVSEYNMNLQKISDKVEKILTKLK